MPTVEALLAYIPIDYPDDLTQKNAARALATAKKTLYGAVGEDVEQLLPGDDRAKELVLMFAKDLYEQRGYTSAKVTGATRQLAADMILQLQMELRRRREGAQA